MRTDRRSLTGRLFASCFLAPACVPTAGPCPDGFEAGGDGNCLEIPTPGPADDDSDESACNPPPDGFADRPAVVAPHPGDAWLANQAEVDDFCLHWDGIDGNLSLGAPESVGDPLPGPSDITDTTSLSCLRWVGGYLHASHNDNLPLLELPSLWGTLGATSIVLNGTMGGIRLPQLHWVGGDFSIQQNVGITTLEVESIAHVEQNLLIRGNSSLPREQAERVGALVCDDQVGGSTDIFDNGD